MAKKADQREKLGETLETGQHRKRKRKGMCLEDRPVLVPNAGGIDIGAREIYVAVPPDRDQDPVRVFETFSEDLERMADWLLRCGVTTVAMESTGVYWIPLYEVLAAKGVTPCLVDASHMKNVPGRRTDWHECQWLQYLHSVGLLRAAFRPDEKVCAVRALVRHRGELVAMASQHVQHMQKALTQMNFQIQHVISDITGVTGMAILDAILTGQRDLSNWPNFETLESKQARKSFGSLWWAVIAQNICSLSGNRAICIRPTSTRSWTATKNSKSY